MSPHARRAGLVRSLTVWYSVGSKFLGRSRCRAVRPRTTKARSRICGPIGCNLRTGCRVPAFTRIGRGWWRVAAARRTKTTRGTAAEGFSSATRGGNSRTSMPIWESLRPGHLSIESTTMDRTRQEIANGRARSSKTGIAEPVAASTSTAIRLRSLNGASARASPISCSSKGSSAATLRRKRSPCHSKRGVGSTDVA